MANTCKQNGNCITNQDSGVCEDCLEFEKQWSSTASTVSAYKSAIAIIRNEAKEFFIRDGKEEIANVLKKLASRIEKDILAPEETRLNEFMEKVENHLKAGFK